MKRVRICAFVIAGISMTIHLMAGVSLLPIYMMKEKPEAPLSHFYAHIVTKVGPMGFVFVYTLPVLALTIWGVQLMINQNKK